MCRWMSLRRSNANDLLFIDSTHVAKTGSDVNTIFFDILPSLAAGVCVHFHDIYYPFEYPKEWVRQGRAWNEAYMLRAFLQYNPTFRICFFNSYIAAFHRHLLKESMYPYALQPGSSLWLRKDFLTMRVWVGDFDLESPTAHLWCPFIRWCSCPCPPWSYLR